MSLPLDRLIATLSRTGMTRFFQKLFADYPQYQTPKRAQILQGLKRTVNGVPHGAVASDGPMKFDGMPSRAWLIPPIFLPNLDDERDAGASAKVMP